MAKVFTGIWIPAEIAADPNLDFCEKIILARIAGFPEAWLTSKTIAEQIGSNASYVRRVTNKLVDKGYLVKTPRQGGLRTLVYTGRASRGVYPGDTGVYPEDTGVYPEDTQRIDIDKNENRKNTCSTTSSEDGGSGSRKKIDASKKGLVVCKTADAGSCHRPLAAAALAARPEFADYDPDTVLRAADTVLASRRVAFPARAMPALLEKWEEDRAAAI